MTRTRVVSALLVMVLLGGPLATLAGAQQQPAPPPAPSAQPPAPDLFQESLKAERAAGQQSAVYGVGAAVTNVFLVPGRAFTCGLGAVVGVGVLALTLGTGYRAAAAVWHEGCGGKWTVSGDDLRPDSAYGRPSDYSEQR
jgi:hypothetical protein